MTVRSSLSLVRVLVAVAFLVAAGTIGYSYGVVAGDVGDRVQSDGPNSDPLAVQESSDEVWVSTHVFRIVDEDAGVVCYVGTLVEGGGIDCLPLDRTALSETDGGSVSNRSPTPTAAR